MKIFFDCEFTGLHKGTTLISIGMISENGKKFYAELSDYDRSQVNDWINKNVLAYRWYHSGRFSWDIPHYYIYGDKINVRHELKKYLSQFDTVELVSDCSHYDMMLFIDLFGTAFDLPSNVCPACYDLNQDIAKFHQVDGYTAFDISREEILSNNGIEIKGDKHNALYDAEVIRALYYVLNGEDYYEIM